MSRLPLLQALFARLLAPFLAFVAAHSPALAQVPFRWQDALDALESGDAARAQAILAGAPDEDTPATWALRGALALRLGQPEEAIAWLERATAAVDDAPSLWLWLATANYRAERWPQALDALEHAGPAARATGRGRLLGARLARLTAHPEDALTWIASAPTAPWFEVRERALALVDLGLAMTAAQELGQALDHPAAALEDVLDLARSIRDAGALEAAAALLDAARLRWRGHAEPTEALAQVESARGHHAAAGWLLESLGAHWAYVAADQYRLAERPHDALRANGAVADPCVRDRQRLAIFVESAWFDRAAASLDAVEACGGMDDALRLRGAWALARAAQWNRALRVLDTIQAPEEKELAVQLARAVRQCQRTPEACP